MAAAAVEINRLENEADRVYQVAVGRLFADETNPIAVLKWKEIFDILESATDRCEDVANVVEAWSSSQPDLRWISNLLAITGLVADRADLRLY